MLLIGKVGVRDSDFFSVTVPYPKPLTMARPAIFLLSHVKPCLTNSFCLAPLCSQLCPNIHQRYNGKGIASWRLHMDRTHMANLTEPCSLLPLGTWEPSKTLADSDSSALDRFIPQRLFLHSKDKAPIKNYSFSSRATDSYALAQVTVSTTSTWAKHMWNSETVPY